MGSSRSAAAAATGCSHRCGCSSRRQARRQATSMFFDAPDSSSSSPSSISGPVLYSQLAAASGAASYTCTAADGVQQSTPSMLLKAMHASPALGGANATSRSLAPRSRRRPFPHRAPRARVRHCRRETHSISPAACISRRRAKGGPRRTFLTCWGAAPVTPTTSCDMIGSVLPTGMHPGVCSP